MDAELRPPVAPEPGQTLAHLVLPVLACYTVAMVDNSNSLVSLIIPTYRPEKALVACLQCAVAQTYHPLEILVIDQTEKHKESTEAFLAGVSEQVRIVNHQPPSAVTARNCGLNEAHGKILVFIDDDTTFEPGFIEAHVAAHDAAQMLFRGE